MTKQRVRELFGVELVEGRGRHLRRLPPKEFIAAFGIHPSAKMTPKKKARAKEVDELFMDMYRVYGIGSIDVFRGAVDKLHSATLHNMTACPDFVVAYMRERLAPVSVQASREKTVARLRSTIASAETTLRKLI